MGRSPARHIHRHVALCYIRKSWTRDEKDAISPERQRTNIQNVCDANNWTPEWYEDTDGHRSGMHEKNRPGWLTLKSRLSDPDVAAIVANDLSRLHRKGWRVGDLLDFVDQHGLTLVLADPRRAIDFSSPHGRIMAQLSAIFDEYYALDISERWKASVAHRRAKGVTVGRAPFGSRRHKQTGFLQPSDEGAWLLPDGTWIPGAEGDEPPVEDALWRGYYACAERILRLYASPTKRMRIVQTMQEEGWAFRDREGQPAPLEVDDVRRIVANWPEYGGLVLPSRARERHPSEQPVDALISQLNTERAIFPVELLGEVARARRDKALGRRVLESANEAARAYPLSVVLICAKCRDEAERLHNPKLRTHLSGHLGRYYKHKPGAGCTGKARSVPRDLVEADFTKLIQLLAIREDRVAEMTQLAEQIQLVGKETKDLERQKAEGIALCKRRIQAAIDLYSDGRMSREEYLRRVERNERELTSWNLRTTESEQLALELGMCLQTVDHLNRMWDVANDEDRQGMVRHLFEEIAYDLDKRQIVDFRLKPWAEHFLMLRVELYAHDQEDTLEGHENRVTPAGIEPAF